MRTTEVKELASQHAFELRQACIGGRLHAVPRGRVSAACGHVPTFEWLPPIELGEAKNGVCRPCRNELTKAGFYVSWAGVIAQESES